MNYCVNFINGLLFYIFLIITRLNVYNGVQTVETTTPNSITDIIRRSRSLNFTTLVNDNRNNQLNLTENDYNVNNNNIVVLAITQNAVTYPATTPSINQQHVERDREAYKIDRKEHENIVDISSDSDKLVHNDRLKLRQRIKDRLKFLKYKRHSPNSGGIIEETVSMKPQSAVGYQSLVENAIYIEKTTEDPLHSEYSDYSLYPIELDECLLGVAQDYLNWWINPNGTLRTDIFPRNRGTTIGLDFSFYNLSEKALFNTVTNYVTQNRIRVILFISLAQNGLQRIPSILLEEFAATLQYLSLSGNEFKYYYDDRLKANRTWADFPKLPSLKELDIRNCRITSLEDYMFANIQNLQKLFLSNNEIIQIHANAFVTLNYLAHLDLSSNTLRRTARSYDIYSQINEGILLPDTLFRSLPNLIFLDLSFTRLLPISVISFIEFGSKLKQLSLCYTGISLLVGGMFRHTNLTVLDISGNPALTNSLRHDSFDGLENTLTILAFEFATVKSLRWITDLVELKMLNLHGNNINQFSNNTFQNLTKLQILDLSSNHISNWYQPVFENNVKLQILNLRDNNINLLTNEMMNDFLNVLFLAIGSNNFICSCMLREFIEMAAINTRGNAFDNSVPNIRLTSTEEFEDYATEATSLDFSRLYHDVVAEDVLQRVSKKRAFSEEPLTTFDDNTSSDYLEDEMDQHLIEEYIENEEYYRAHIDYDVFGRSYSYYVYNVNNSNENILKTFEKCGLLDIPNSLYQEESPTYKAKNIRNVQGSDLPRNHLIAEISLSVNFTFQLIDYHENDYNCIDQATSQMLLFADLDICVDDRASIQPDDASANSSSNTKDIRIAFIILSVVLVVGVIIYLVYALKCSNLRYFWINLRNSTVLSMMHNENEFILKKPKKGENNTHDDDYMYDVFVSYSEQNREWVLDELLPNIEKRNEINVCLHERDFQVGLSILENIISCMDRSRVLLLVMSESFLSSNWCQFEMHLAQHRLLETRRDQLILVLLEDISQKKRPKILDYLMKTKTYIIWPAVHSAKTDKKKILNEKMANKLLHEERNLFWKRLKKAIINANDWDPEKITTA